MNNSVQTMSSFLTNDVTKKYLENMLGKKSEQFITNLSTIVGSNPQLNLCDRKSILGCALKAVGLGLSFDPNLGFSYVIPYNDNSTGEKIATFQMGTKGFVQLAQRSGQIKKLNAMAVKEGEFKGRDAFGDPIIEWLPEATRVNAKTVGYMAAIQTVSGFEKVIYWSVEDMQKHAEKYSQSYRNALKFGKTSGVVWLDNFDRMAEKTILKSLISKYAPMSIEMAEAVKYDQATILVDPETGEETMDYVDNKSDVEPTITKEQIKELATMLGKDKKISDLTEYKAIKDIPAKDFIRVKNILKDDGVIDADIE